MDEVARSFGNDQKDARPKTFGRRVGLPLKYFNNYGAIWQFDTLTTPSYRYPELRGCFL